MSWIRRYGDKLVGKLEREGIWWDRSWAQWTPTVNWAQSGSPQRHID